MAIYATFSALWIYLSDHLVGMLIKDRNVIVSISVFKGILFILLTSWLLYRLILHYVGDLERANRAVTESERRMTKAQEMAHLGSWELDVLNNALTWSDEVYRIFGLTPQAFAATYEAFLDVVHPDDREAVDSAFTQSFREGVDAYEIEHRLVRKSTGEIRYVWEKCEHVRDEKGVVVRSYGMVYDVTDSRLAKEALAHANEELEARVAHRTKELELSRQELEEQNEELRATYAELEIETAERIRALKELREKDAMLLQQNRLAAMGEMLGNIAHQWRQPLNVLGLMVQEMALLYESGEWNKELLDARVGSFMDLLEHMSQTIDDFRDFTAPSREKTPFLVENLVRKTLSLVHESFKAHGISVSVSCTASQEVQGYANEYGQVLVNLLMNAKDALVERGTKDAQVEVHSWVEDGYSVVTVTDNAGGISESLIDRVFDAYFTTKGPAGTGIGLFMAKSIIEKSMGGRMTVRNVGSGAEFRIEVPVGPSGEECRAAEPNDYHPDGCLDRES